MQASSKEDRNATIGWLQPARNNRHYKKRCPTREAIGQKESANAHENNFELKKKMLGLAVA